MGESEFRWTRSAFPTPVSSPDEFLGGDHLCFYCTQTDLPPSQQKKLVQRWIEALPSIEVRTVSFTTCLNQSLFDAVCQIRGLQNLWVKWSSVQDLSAISHAKSLKNFRLGDSSKIVSVEPLLEAAGLLSAELIGLRNFKNFTSLSGFTALKKLSFEGSDVDDRPIRMPSYEPFGALTNLSKLSLASTFSTDGSLAPLHRLTNLDSLTLSNDYSLEQVALLHKRLGKRTQCSLFTPYIEYIERCETCDSHMVMLTGASRPFICPVCEACRLKEHSLKYVNLAGLPSNSSFEADGSAAAQLKR